MRPPNPKIASCESRAARDGTILQALSKLVIARDAPEAEMRSLRSVGLDRLGHRFASKRSVPWLWSMKP